MLRSRSCSLAAMWKILRVVIEDGELNFLSAAVVTIVSFVTIAIQNFPAFSVAWKKFILYFIFWKYAASPRR